MADCHRLYVAAPPHIRRQLNQAVFERIFVEDEEIQGARLITPFGELLELAEQADAREEEWGSERQLRRYLRTSPLPHRQQDEVEEAIARILGENERTLAAMNRDQGSNVLFLAEGEGFEPPGPGLPAQRFSRPPHSTALPPLRAAIGTIRRSRGEVAEWLKATAC